MQILETNRSYLTNDARRKLVKLIYKNGPLSRKEMSKQLGIRQASVNSFIKQLEGKGLLKPGRLNNGVGPGRPAAHYEVNPSFRAVLGIHFRIEEIVGVCCDLKGKVLASVNRHPKPLHDVDDLVNHLVETIAELKILAQVKDNDILAAGFGMPGVVDRENGILTHYYEFPWWRNIPIVDRLKQRLPLSCCIVQEVCGFAVGEQWFGVARGVDNFAYVDVENGVALAMALNGEVLLSRTHTTEWGHATIMVDGPQCGCGNRGCLDHFLRTDYLGERIKDQLGQGKRSRLEPFLKHNNGLHLSDIITAVQQGDEVTKTVLGNAFEYLGVGISNLINTFSPSLIVIGGELSACGDMLLERVRKVVRLRAYPPLVGMSEVKLASLEPVTGGAQGAVATVLSEMFEHLRV